MALYLIKTVFFFFLTSSLALAKEQNSSFSFSKEKGLKVLSSSEEKESTAKALIKPNSKKTTDSSVKLNTNKKTSSASVDSKTEKVKSSTSLNSNADTVQSSANLNSTADTVQPSANLNSTADTVQSSLNLNSTEEKNTKVKNSISESFAPKTKEVVEGSNFLDTLTEDVSWFFQERKTKHKLAVVPVYSYNRTQKSRLGLRFFAYSSDKKGYYLSLSGSKYLFSPFSRVSLFYIGNRKGTFRLESSFIYDNHFENHFGDKGMEASLSDSKKLYAHRFVGNYQIFYQAFEQSFYAGLKAQLFFRKEQKEYQEEKSYYEDEFFLFLQAFVGYDSRENWKKPSEGAFHQIAFGCKSILAYPGSYCKGEGDFRFYVSLFKNTQLHYSLKNSVLALRAFAGSSFFSASTYSTAYSLTGESPFQSVKSLRGFKQNRFRGDKIYFLQTEIRFPLWDKYLDGVLFTELGEVADFKKSFKGNFVMDLGGGLNIGLPPDYDMNLRLNFGTGLDRQKERNYNFIVSLLHAF